MCHPQDNQSNYDWASVAYPFDLDPVKAAIAEYARRPRMGNAAIAYADAGWPIFPVCPVTKKPLTKDWGGTIRWGATRDTRQIIKWWTKWPDALIALPMGAATGVWAIDVDTPEDHDDGVSTWAATVAKHGALPLTREHRSATGGAHYLFRWHPERPVGCGGRLGAGISVKGEGGFIVAPPSWRAEKNRAYTLSVDAEYAEAPEWLYALVTLHREAPEHSPSNGWIGQLADPGRLASAMRFVPNDGTIIGLPAGALLPREGWVKVNLTLVAACRNLDNGYDIGYRIFEEFSKRSEKHHNIETVRKRWADAWKSPPNRLGAKWLYRIAWHYGWIPPEEESCIDSEQRALIEQQCDEYAGLGVSFNLEDCIYADPERIEAALETVPNDIEYLRRICGAVIYNELGEEDGYVQFHRWCCTDPDYDADKCDDEWSRMSFTLYDARTLYFHADRYDPEWRARI